MNAPDALHEHLRTLGFDRLDTVHYELEPPRLYEEAIRRGEARLVADGPLAARTDPHTGRSPNDRFVVDEPSSRAQVAWGKVNKQLSEDAFDTLLAGMVRYAVGRELFVRDCYAGADERYRIRVRVVTEKAWHSLFALNMFLRPASEEELDGFEPDVTVVDLCDYRAPAVAGLNSSTFITLHLGRGLVLIGGTHYAGEVKKSVFSFLNYRLPKQQVFPMHCSANVGPDGDAAVFFGLSGTGKTTLSADASRTLVGDDE